MAVVIISYNLKSPATNYDAFHDALRFLKAKPVQDAVCAVRTTRTISSVWEQLWQHMDQERDRLFVIPFDNSQPFYSANSITKMKNL